MTRTEAEGIGYEIQVTGLKGGHSGSEINKERGNAVMILGRALYDTPASELLYSCFSVSLSLSMTEASSWPSSSDTRTKGLSQNF